VLWQAKATSALGQVTDELTSNGVETVSTRNQTRGWLLNTTGTAQLAAGAVVQSWGFSYDEAGNLRKRTRNDAAGGPASTETFDYDPLNRLMTAETIVGADNYDKLESFGYDNLGNLTQKNDASYNYNTGCHAGPRAAGPHAVCSVGDALYNYDANGNATSDGTRSYRYNGSNRVTHIANISPSGLVPPTVDYVYDANDNRVIQDVSNGTGHARTLYVGLGGTGKSLYERTTNPDGSVQHVEFVYAGANHGGNAFAVRVVPASGSTPTTQFYSFDHLGSVTAMTDQIGQVLGAASGANSTLMNYDAWGLRRNPDGEVPTTPGSFNLQTGHREFTGHETIPDFGLVNMNGRIYDPILGRFLAPDTNVQFPTDMQSYNRYTYVNNNPLSFTDPTGFFSLGSISAMQWTSMALAATGIVTCAISSGALCGVAFGLMTTLLNVSAAVTSGQSLGQTLAISAIGIFSGAFGGAIGGSISDGLAGALVGGAISGTVTSGIVGLATGHLTAGGMLDGALQGALWGAAGWGAKQLTPIDQASLTVPEGGVVSGGGHIEKVETVESIVAANSQDDEVDKFLAENGYVGEPEYESADPAVLARVQRALEFQTAARAAYAAVGPTGTSADQVNSAVDEILSRKYGAIGTAATTNSSAEIEMNYDPNPLTRQGTFKHELVHQQTALTGTAMFGGKDTPAFVKWWNNPQNYAADEVSAYTAGIRYLQQVLLFTRPMTDYH
jgi:RHS repeat-associated protein